MTTVTFVFGIRPAQVPPLRSFLAALPRLCRGGLAGADLGLSTAWGLFVVSLRLAEPVSPRIVARLGYWAWRAGAQADEPGAEDRLQFCDVKALETAPRAISDRAADLLACAGLPDASAEPLALRLDLRSPECDGLDYDARRGMLFVPSPHAPWAGDHLPLVVIAGDGSAHRTTATVAAVRRAGQIGPNSPAGFVLGLTDPPPTLAATLDAFAGAGRTTPRRMAPRYPVQARATLRPARQAARVAAGPATAAVVENLSQAGAFVATNQPFAEGDSVELEVVLPQGVLAATGVVARKDAHGVGLRFDARPEAERAIASAVRGIASRRRRVLVVNEDSDARRSLAEALEARGFAVVTVGDGLSGLRALSADIVSVDAVVTHLAPRMDGEEFVRRLRQAGGHAALAIVVVDSVASAERLRGAGVDGVFAKEARPEAIAAAVDRAAELRRRGALSAAPVIALAARG